MNPNLSQGKRATDLAGNIRDHHRQSTRIRARILDAVGEFDEGGAAPSGLARSARRAGWRGELRVSEATAFEYVFVDREGRKYRVLYGAFEYGAVSYTTVRFLLRYITEDTEPYVKITTRDDGMMCFEALLPAVTGQELMAALKLAQLSQYGFDGVDEEELRDPDKVDALLEEAAGVDEACPATQTAEPKPRRTSMWDAIKDTAEAMEGGSTVFGCAGEHHGHRGRSRLDAEQLAGEIGGSGAVCGKRDDAPAPDGRQGVDVECGPAAADRNHGQVAALLPAWGHQCAMPGCTHSRFLQMRHLRD